MTKIKILIIVLLITILGGFLRFYKIVENPVSLTVDEVSFGYNAYSILKTGRDEYGKFLPITFKSVGDYKNPFVIYSMVPSIAVFGLNEFGVRFPTALISTLSIPMFFFLFLRLGRKGNLALLATLMLAISPWHIYFSRFASEQLIAGVFIGVGVLFFLKMLDGKRIWAVFSALFFILSIYTYHAERLFVPLFVLSLLLINFRSLFKERRKLLIFTFSLFILALPLLYLMFFGPDIARADMVFITKDLDFTRYVLLNDSKIHFSSLIYIPLLFFYWARKYLSYFSPSFLFYSGLPMTIEGSYGLGVFYLFEFITLPIGIYCLIKRQLPNKAVILSWILLGLIPASLTNNEQHPGRTVFILPAVIFISSLGFYEFIQVIRRISQKYLKYFVVAAFSLLVIWDLTHAILTFAAYFPMERDEDFMDGTKEAVEYILRNQDKYREIIFDPYRGIVARNIVSIPHMYILFYSQYDPHTYQTEVKQIATEYYSFGKYTIRPITFSKDQNLKDVLFVGSPWSLDEKNKSYKIKKENILKKIYLKNGDLAFLIVKSDQ